MIHTRRVGRQVYCSLDKSRYQYCLQRLETLVDPAVQLESFPIGEFLIEAEAVAED
jgi:ArsR family transcriptional regulator